MDAGASGRGEQHDVVIVGAGTAGVSCALECFDIQLDTAVFEANERPGGQLVDIPHSVRNLAIGSNHDGPALRDALEQAAAILGDRLRRSHPVARVDVGERWIEVDGVRIRGRALVIAMGTSHEQLPAAADGAYGGDVTYLLEARPGRFVGRDVVVIGGGDSGTLDALELARAGSNVWLVHRSDALSARHDIVEQVRHESRIEDLPGWELESLDGGDRLEGVTLVRHADGERRRLDAGGLVVKIARVPRTELLRGQLELDRAGAIVVDQELQTSCDGVFAAGDVVAGSYARIASAAGQGSRAARSVLRYLQSRT
jgi:thioredoxin reductase (NADPH)